MLIFPLFFGELHEICSLLLFMISVDKYTDRHAPVHVGKQKAERAKLSRACNFRLGWFNFLFFFCKL